MTVEPIDIRGATDRVLERIDILLSCGDDLDVEFPNWNQSMFVA